MQDASHDVLERIAVRLKAMGNPLRLRILHALEGGELSVSGILDRVGSRQANVSKHLFVLRSAGLVSSRRSGANIYYRIKDDAVLTICKTVCDSLLAQATNEVTSIERGRAVMLGEKR